MIVLEKIEQESRKADISMIALNIFLQKGYAGTSMSDVAKASGIRKPSLYHHFSSKEELFLAALSADVSEPMQKVGFLLDEARGTPQERFRDALGLFYDAMVCSSIGSLTTVISETSRHVPAVAEGFYKGYILPFEGALERAFSPCVAAGSHRDVPQVAVNQIVFGPLLGIAISGVMFQAAPSVAENWSHGRSRGDFVEMIDGLLRK